MTERKARKARRASVTSDPFGERAGAARRARFNVLGGAFTVESSNTVALRLAIDAFGGLPPHGLRSTPRAFRVRLVITNHGSTWADNEEPPRPTLTGYDGLLCATVDAGNFAVVDIPLSRALVCMSPEMLRHRYHARYELIELAMVTLASRALSLVPLHAACVGAGGTGILVMGSSGTGKSTLALHALSNGMQLLSEDSAFVELDNLRVTGLSNYLHLTPSSLDFLGRGSLLDEIRRSPTVDRRSGARKYEVDLRKLPGRLAPAPLRLAATVFLSRRKAAPANALSELGRKEFLARLRREQPYAAGLANWRRFERLVSALPAYELRRAAHPDLAVRELESLLSAARKPA